MTRDLALKQAIAYAHTEKAVAVIWCYDESKSWTWADYSAKELYQAVPNSVRYILPQGEITKLS